jgi:hypothetical protein
MGEWSVNAVCAGVPHVLIITADSMEDALSQVDADRKACLTETYRTAGGNDVTLTWGRDGANGANPGRRLA